MTQPVLDIRQLSKLYRTYSSEWLRVASWAGIRVAGQKEFWAIKDVSFSVAPGEAVGIAGKNGAGKSTLLKMIAGTLTPTAGGVFSQGRVAAILELGMGFNPEFTGRENAKFAASLMGYSTEEVKAVIPEIEEFAEIRNYFDQPVRTYSSGMQMRLAFAVATAYRPDLLIVDEALSVGDGYFQHKSFERIRKFKEQGTALLLVSHDKGAIQAVCDRAILLDMGQKILEGDPESVMDYYNAMLAVNKDSTTRQERTKDGQFRTISGSLAVSTESVSLLGPQGAELSFVEVETRVAVELKARVNQNVEKLVAGFQLKDRLGNQIFGTNTHHYQQSLERLVAGELVTFRFEFQMNLGPGSYSIATSLHGEDTHYSNNYEWRDLALVFTVTNTTQPTYIGSTWLKPNVLVTR